MRTITSLKRTRLCKLNPLFKIHIYLGVTGRTISTCVKHLRTFYIFVLTRISFKDFPCKDMIGRPLKISLSSGWFCIMCQFSIETCLIFGTEGSYFVTKGRISLLVLFSCSSARDLSVNLVSYSTFSIRLCG